MSSANLAAKYRETGADTIVALRNQAERLSAAMRPHVVAGIDRAGDAIDRAGDAIVHLKDATSRKVSHAMDQRDARTAKRAAAVQLPAIASAAARLARRHPLWLAAGGVSVAALGYLVWRGRQEDSVEDENEAVME